MKKKLKKFLGIIVVLAIIGIVVWQIPTIADWGDYESYDSSSSYDDWGSSSSYDYDDWGSSSSYDYDDWGSSWSSWDDGYHSSSFYYFGSGSRGSKLSLIIAWVFVIFIAFYLFKNRHNTNSFLRGNRPSIDAEMQRRRNREVLFGVSDAPIENQIQEIDPMFNKAEFLSWASDMFVKLQYAWSDRNLEEIRHFVTPDLYEQTNNQVQRYIQNKQINKLERISVNLYRLYSFAEEGDREILRVVLESKMIDYIIDETTQKVVRGNQAINVVNPYILTFVRKAGVKTPEGGVKPVTMNCPNCGGATTILSSGKCPYCGSIITTRDNHWTLSEMKRYNPNA
ncbi:MAG: Tim44 domain-containing protein [Clostridia bacterium]|nr:Tim44 domain-containing protein [Clostridia bacterium]